MPNNPCLHRVPLKAYDQGKLCVSTDTLLYRMATCVEVNRHVVLDSNSVKCAPEYRASTHPMSMYHFPNIPLRQWPKHNVAIWILAHVIQYKIQHRRTLWTRDYIDFSWWTIWKCYQWSKQDQSNGNYLHICYWVAFPTHLLLAYICPCEGHGEYIQQSNRRCNACIMGFFYASLFNSSVTGSFFSCLTDKLRPDVLVSSY